MCPGNTALSGFQDQSRFLQSIHKGHVSWSTTPGVLQGMDMGICLFSHDAAAAPAAALWTGSKVALVSQSAPALRTLAHFLAVSNHGIAHRPCTIPFLLFCSKERVLGIKCFPIILPQHYIRWPCFLASSNSGITHSLCTPPALLSCLLSVPWWLMSGHELSSICRMLATCMNALCLQSALEGQGVPTRVQTAIEMRVCPSPLLTWWPLPSYSCTLTHR